MNRAYKYFVSVSSVVILLSCVFIVMGQEEYKLQTRDAISLVVNGKLDAAVADMDGYLKKNPGDLESMYGLAVAYSQKRDIGRAIDYVKKAVDAGLPFGRFLAGPRDLLEPLTGSDEFKALVKKYGEELVHGPMLGPAQKKWLFEKLKASTGTFKVLASPVPWSFGAKPGSPDPWQGYKD